MVCLWNLSPLTSLLASPSSCGSAVYPCGMLCCYGTRGLAAAGCRCCLVHQPISSANQRMPWRQQWTCSQEPASLHKGRSDRTSVVSFSLLTDVETVSKVKADACVLHETCQTQKYLCVLGCFYKNGSDSTWQKKLCLFTYLSLYSRD